MSGAFSEFFGIPGSDWLGFTQRSTHLTETTAITTEQQKQHAEVFY